ncbi:energy-coupled thiamine transporter ThiT [Brevibacillus sp. SYP-B805]|uniref:energy-coupled thiamine transporter ThiT n=1 Tax=Brevibacillus sp. SYP-B805 TaxID=1578199 RepID=UPI0013ED8CE5|nr:energy-coupled thiamine transporter ThiT [Brevibacillus sp. SYP-B805]NGQ93823.1 energy-coupled thiamine transporter ThiT [Brevibacillus sp. SYP-B805]
MQNHRLLTMMEIAIMAALGYVLSNVKVFEMPQGGSISLVMVPIALIAIRRGLVPGLITGLIVGELNHLIGGYVVHPVQLLLDYPLAFAALGLAGVARLSRMDRQGKRIAALWGGLLLAVGVRFACHFISGVVWFGEYAPAGMPVPLYSFLYNITYLLPEMIITGVVLTFMVTSAPQLFFLNRAAQSRFS